MATRKPTLGTGPNDIDIQATKAVRKPRTDVVDASGKPIRELTRAEKDAQYKKIKAKYEAGRAATKAKIAANPKVVKSRPEGSVIPRATKKAAAKVKPKITKAEQQIAKELSPKGMKKSAKDQAKAMDKKYPGLYKNN